MEDFIPIALAIAIIIKALDVVRYATNGKTRQVVTQVLAWALSALVLFLLAQTDFASGVVIGDWNLSELNAWSILFWSLGIGSGASVGVDLRKALDGSDTATVPPLGGGS